jgi:branched-chain amino acid transport system substrate-binding protein
MKKVLAAIVAGVMVFACLTGCSKEENKPETDTNAAVETEENEENAEAEETAEGGVIKIGVFEPTTGENGGGGAQEVLGARYANKVYNTVDINGTTYSIELVEVDNQSDKTAAVTAAQSLISSGVMAVVGSYGSGVSIAAGETFAQAEVAAVGASCTNPQVTLGNDYYFRVCFLDPFQGTVMASYAIDNGYTKAAVISQNGDDYSTGLAEYFKIAFTGLGGEIVADETYQTNESDFNAILTTVKAASPDVIFVPSSITTATLILPQAQAAGVEAVIMAGDTWENESIISDAAEGVVFSTFFDENDTENTVASDFVKGFKEYLAGDSSAYTLNGNTDGVAAVSALGYDAYMVIYKALENFDGEELTSAALRDAIANVSYDGVTGSITFDENGDANKDLAYIKTVQDGKFVFVKTQEAFE